MKTEVALEVQLLELTHCDGCGKPLPELREPVSVETIQVSARCRDCGHLSVRTRVTGRTQRRSSASQRR